MAPEDEGANRPTGWPQDRDRAGTHVALTPHEKNRSARRRGTNPTSSRTRHHLVGQRQRRASRLAIKPGHRVCNESHDGRDANSYVGAAWCFGLHDRGWTRRPVFGTVRSMNAAGLERKFDMARYLDEVARLVEAEG